MKQTYTEYLSNMKGILMNHQIPSYEQFIKNISSYASLSNYLDSVLFILDYRVQQFLFISPNCIEVEGYTQEELYAMGPVGIMNLFHEEDADIIMNVIFPEGSKSSKKIPASFRKNMKVSFNYRLQQKDGSFIELQQQFSTLLFDDQANSLVIMGTIHKLENSNFSDHIICNVAYKGPFNNWFNVYTKKYLRSKSFNSSNLSDIELEIVRLISMGLTSKQIAFETKKSVETIKTQRKNIIAKTNAQCMTDVVVMALQKKWI